MTRPMSTAVTCLSIGLLVLTFTIGLLSPTARSEGRKPIANEAELRQAMKELSNRGRWGPDDELGASNPIAPAKRKQAAAPLRIDKAMGSPLNPIATF